MKDCDGRYLFYNRAAAESVGKPAADVIGRTDAEAFDEIIAQTFAGSDGRVMATGVAETSEERVTIDGTTRCYLVTKTPYHDVSGTVVGLIGISRDVTERQEAEDKLRDSERRLAEGERIAHVGSWENDLVHDRFTWSAEVYRILGLVPEDGQMSVAEFRSHIHPDDLIIQTDASAKAQQGDGSYEAQYRVVRPDGSVRIVRSGGRDRARFQQPAHGDHQLHYVCDRRA